MLRFLLCLVITMSFAFAEVGHVLQVTDETGSIKRGEERIPLTMDAVLEEGDVIQTGEAVAVIYLMPLSQLAMSKNTEIKITKNLIEGAKLQKSVSVIDFVKGIIRLQATKVPGLQIEQKVVADNVTFAVRGTEFELAYAPEEIDLVVLEGEVEVSAPDIHTLVPEIVKAKNGFRFDRKKRAYGEGKFLLRMPNHPGFLSSDKIKSKWAMKRQHQKKAQNKK